MMIYRARNKDYPTLPKKLQDFEIPDEFRKCNDQDFLLAHFKDRDVSIIMFGTKKNLQLLLESPYWLMDGTFRCCPWPCYQLYTVHGVIGHGENKKTVPLVYGLLSRKTERCYFLFLELLRTQAQNKYGFDLSPNIVVTDFELAAIKAVKKVYPNAAQKGCFFHLCQSIWRQIQAANLANKYGEDSTFAHKLRHIAALAYLNAEEIPPAFSLLKKHVSTCLLKLNNLRCRVLASNGPHHSFPWVSFEATNRFLMHYLRGRKLSQLRPLNT